MARQLSGALLVIACLAALAVAGWLAAQTPPSNRAAVTRRQTAQDLNALEEQSEKLRDDATKLREESIKLQAALDGQRREAESFRWLLTLILGLGALYSLSQAIYSYLNVQELKGQAQKAIDDLASLRKENASDLKTFERDVRTTAEADFQKFRTACENQFPMFVGFETTLVRMSSQLEKSFKLATMGDSFYRMLDDLKKQEIYYYEKSAASLQFVEVSSPDRMFHIFRGFCRFYTDKYRAERKAGAGDRNDLLRAQYYLYRADLLPGGKDFRVLNERGRMAVQAEATPDWDEAKRWFGESADLKQDQQSAHYNLATIDHLKAVSLKTPDPAEAKKLFTEAVRKLRIAGTYTNWEDSPSLKGTSIDYNLACGLSQLAELEPDAAVTDDLLKESFDALARAVKLAPGERDQFETDRKDGGDLNKLNRDPRYQSQLDEFAVLIRKARA